MISTFKKARVPAAAVVLAISLLFQGCEAMLIRDYYVEKKHESLQKETATLPSEQSLTYENIFARVKNIIHAGLSEEKFRLSGYNGSLEDDLKRISQEIATRDPLGAYAVSTIGYEIRNIVRYQEVSLSIQYKKTPEEISAVRQVVSPGDFDSRMAASLSEFKETAVFSIDYYNETIYDLENRIERLYYSLPHSAYGLKEQRLTFYPESGTSRIVEISTEYNESPEKLKTKAAETRSAAAQIADIVKADSELETLLALHEYFIKNIEYDSEAMRVVAEMGGNHPRTDPYTAYGALVMKVATPEGYALAFKILCDYLGILCQVVVGEENEIPRIWNLVFLEGKWYHVDCASDDVDSTEENVVRDYFCAGSEMLSAERTWSLADYPSVEKHNLALPETDKGKNAAS